MNTLGDSSLGLTPANLTPIEALSQRFHAEQNAVNKLLLQQLDSPIALIPQLATHLITSGGKRLRPLLTLASSSLCGYQGDRHISLAACIELIHAATLLHDDVIDESPKRRGVSTAHTIWGNKASILVGDFLFSRAFQLMVEHGSSPILHILSQAAATITQGEVLQLTTGHSFSTSLATYFEMIQAKTAALFAAACEIGAVIADQSQQAQNALRDYGYNLGIAFQLMDDILDYRSPSPQRGKALGDDFHERKVTLPVLLAYQQGDEQEREFWQKAFEEGDQTPENFRQALTLLEKHQVFKFIHQQAQGYVTKAHTHLSYFAPTALRSLLEEVATFCSERGY